MIPLRTIKRRPLGLNSSNLPEGMHPVLRRIYAVRGITEPDQLDVSLSRLHPVHLLSGIEQALRLLKEAIEYRRKVLIVGDFDADGATSTALALRALRAVGATEVDYLVPNRFEYGYGLTPEIVATSLKLEPDIIMTVDNGIASVQGVAAARLQGIKVIVTDHHLPGKQLPDADAIVNPNLENDPFPSKTLAGVGVTFYLMMALRMRLREENWFERHHLSQPNMAQFLDLVALGTVADVTPLDHNNRILIEQGLRRIRAGRCNPGIRMLLQVAGRDFRRIVASDLAYAAAPRLNAAGRLEDMSLGIECLLTESDAYALTLAERLAALNQKRRDIEAQMQSEALELIMLEAQTAQGSGLPSGLCLYDKSWHQGVIGIVASRLKDRFHRPVVAFADAGEGVIRGSARSVPSVHIRDLLDDIANQHPGLLCKFGGHAMAAGLSLEVEKFSLFREVFDCAMARVFPSEHVSSIVYSDGELAPDELSLDLALLLRHAGPWGQGFPEPQFDGVFEILKRRLVGEKHLKLILKAMGTADTIEAMLFNIDMFEWHEAIRTVQLVYRLDVNNYQGRLSPQLIVTHLQPAPLLD
jgi:single-stranded-DNA-specific exonuclease